MYLSLKGTSTAYRLPFTCLTTIFALSVLYTELNPGLALRTSNARFMIFHLTYSGDHIVTFVPHRLARQSVTVKDLITFILDDVVLELSFALAFEFAVPFPLALVFADADPLDVEVMELLSSLLFRLLLPDSSAIRFLSSRLLRKNSSSPSANSFNVNCSAYGSDISNSLSVMTESSSTTRMSISLTSLSNGSLVLLKISSRLLRRTSALN